MSLEVIPRNRQSHSMKPERQEHREKKIFDPLDNEAVSPHKNFLKNQKNLQEFKKQASQLEFYPLGSRENYPGNYDNYLQITLSHIAQMKNLRFDHALEDKKIFKGVPDYTNGQNNGRKILLLDLDETLIHADFNGEFANDKSTKYDTVISFKENEKDFEDNKYFEVGIFTASVKEYADAVIDYLDPNKNMIKFRLYRNNCINVNDKIYVKDLRIIKGINLKDIILIDNSMYSFAAQLTNGILINSFYNDKNDIELYNVLGYLLNFILKINDVRLINEQFFNFQRIANDIGANQ